MLFNICTRRVCASLSRFADNLLNLVPIPLGYDVRHKSLLFDPVENPWNPPSWPSVSSLQGHDILIAVVLVSVIMGGNRLQFGFPQ